MPSVVVCQWVWLCVKGCGYVSGFGCVSMGVVMSVGVVMCQWECIICNSYKGPKIGVALC